MHRKLKILFVIVILAALVVSPAQAQEAPQSSTPELPAEAFTLQAVGLMYAPVNNTSWWKAAICSNMTAGGCAYFKNNEADTLFQAGQDVTGGGVQNFQVVKELQEDVQLWKMTVSIWSGDQKKLTDDVYVIARFDEAQNKWLLDRVMYGPYLGFAK